MVTLFLVLLPRRCGDCSFGSLLLVRPLKAREVACGSGGGGGSRSDDSVREEGGGGGGGRGGGEGGLWAVPVRVEAAGPLPFSQVCNMLLVMSADHE